MTTSTEKLETAYQNARVLGDNNSLWNLWELAPYPDSTLVIISRSQNADSELLDQVAHQLHSPHPNTPMFKSGLSTEEIIENLLTHKNFTDEAREKILADVRRGYYA